MAFSYSNIVLLCLSKAMLFRGSLIEFLIDKTAASHNRQFQATPYFVYVRTNRTFVYYRQIIMLKYTHQSPERPQRKALNRIVYLLENGEKTGRW